MRDDGLCPHGRARDAYPCPDCQGAGDRVAPAVRPGAYGIPQADPGRDVMLAFPHDGTVTTTFMLSVWDACSAPGSRVAELRELRTGPVMPQARNKIARMFLDSGCTWLWTVDSDMVFTASTLPALLAAADPDERPVMGALCWVQFGPQAGEMIPTMYKAIREQEEGRFIFQSLQTWPMGEPVQVAATGAACLLIHRDVFKRISERNPEWDGLWFSGATADRFEFGEDFSFCMRCAHAGIPVHVHTGVEVGHTKTTIIGRVSP